MGRLEREATQERNRIVQERRTVFSSLPVQTFMVHGIKAPALENISILLSPESNPAQKLKALMALRRVLHDFEKNFPEPTPENTWHPNSHLLCQVRDEFFKHCVGLSCERLRTLRLGINFFIIIYDYDPPYRMMIDWWAKQLKIQNWDFTVPITMVQRNWPWWQE